MFCPNCGNDVPNGTRFCGKCGKDLSTSETSSPERKENEKGNSLLPDNIFPRSAKDYVGLMNGFVCISNVFIIIAFLCLTLVKIDIYSLEFSATPLTMPWKIITLMDKYSSYLDGQTTGLLVYAFSFYVVVALLILSFREMKKNTFGSFAMVAYILNLIVLFGGKIYLNATLADLEDDLYSVLASQIISFGSAYGFMIFFCILGLAGIFFSKYANNKKVFLPYFIGKGK